MPEYSEVFPFQISENAAEQIAIICVARALL